MVGDEVLVRDTGYSFDYNRQNKYDVQVISRDPVTQREDMSRVSVLLRDVNNLNPIFKEQLYRVEVQADAEVGTLLLTLDAFDGDTSFPELTYSLVTGKFPPVCRA